MRVMIDTNVFLDVMIRREAFYDSARRILSLCEKGDLQGFVSASSVTDIFYLVRRQLHSTEQAYQALGAMLKIAKVLPVTNEEVLSAYLQKAPDFEDCLLAVCAISNQCDVIVTRNQKDFRSLGIPAVSPDELLQKLEI